MTFASDLAKFRKKVGLRADQVVRKVTLDLTRDLVRATPVDTGMARSSYFFGSDRTGGKETSPSKNGSPTNRRAAQFTSTLQAGGVFYIVNNLPYIMRLEFGSSQQAPAGMARITVDRFQSYLDAAAGSLR